MAQKLGQEVRHGGGREGQEEGQKRRFYWSAAGDDTLRAGDDTGRRQPMSAALLPPPGQSELRTYPVGDSPTMLPPPPAVHAATDDPFIVPAGAARGPARDNNSEGQEGWRNDFEVCVWGGGGTRPFREGLKVTPSKNGGLRIWPTIFRKVPNLTKYFFEKNILFTSKAPKLSGGLR